MKRTARPLIVLCCGLLPLLTGCITIYEAASKGDVATVKRCLQRGVDVNAKTTDTKRPDVDELTPLIIAAEADHLDVVKFLVDNGANVNANTTDGMTALISAAGAGHLDVVKLLVDKGANANHRRTYKTALEYAAEAGHLDVVKFLIDKTTDVNRDDKNVYKAVMGGAVTKGHLDVVTFCVDNGVGVNDPAEDDMTWLGLAASWGRLDVVEFLVGKGSDVNRKIRIVTSYESPLWAAASQGHTAVVEFLLRNGAGDHAHQDDIERAMAIAMQRGYQQTAGVLLGYFEPGKDARQPK